jgi:hypothetical protein
LYPNLAFKRDESCVTKYQEYRDSDLLHSSLLRSRYYFRHHNASATALPDAPELGLRNRSQDMLGSPIGICFVLPFSR